MLSVYEEILICFSCLFININNNINEIEIIFIHNNWLGEHKISDCGKFFKLIFAVSKIAPLI